MAHRLVYFAVELPAHVADWIELEADLSRLQPQDIAATLLTVSVGSIRSARADRALLDAMQGESLDSLGAGRAARFPSEGTSNTFRNVSN